MTNPTLQPKRYRLLQGIYSPFGNVKTGTESLSHGEYYVFPYIGKKYGDDGNGWLGNAYMTSDPSAQPEWFELIPEPLPEQTKEFQPTTAAGMKAKYKPEHPLGGVMMDAVEVLKESVNVLKKIHEHKKLKAEAKSSHMATDKQYKDFFNESNKANRRHNENEKWLREHPMPSSHTAPAPVKPKIVCLCGSTRFHHEFVRENFNETMKGKVVLSVGFFANSPDIMKQEHGEGVGITKYEKIMLDELHKRKIDLADEVFVLNVGGYIGESTRSEIEYAEKSNKPIKYLEPISAPAPVIQEGGKTEVSVDATTEIYGTRLEVFITKTISSGDGLAIKQAIEQVLNDDKVGEEIKEIEDLKLKIGAMEAMASLSPKKYSQLQLDEAIEKGREEGFNAAREGLQKNETPYERQAANDFFFNNMKFFSLSKYKQSINQK